MLHLRRCIRETKMLFYMIGLNSVQVYTHSKYPEAGCVNVNGRLNLSLVFKTRQENLAKKKFLDVWFFNYDTRQKATETVTLGKTRGFLSATGRGPFSFASCATLKKQQLLYRSLFSCSRFVLFCFSSSTRNSSGQKLASESAPPPSAAAPCLEIKRRPCGVAPPSCPPAWKRYDARRVYVWLYRKHVGFTTFGVLWETYIFFF